MKILKTLATCIISVLLGIVAMAVIIVLGLGLCYVTQPLSELFYAILIFLPIGWLGYVIYIFITESKRSTKMK